MNVLFLTDGVHPFQIGGMQKHSLILIKLLSKKVNHIRVLHCGGEGYSADKFHMLFKEEGCDNVSETYIKFPKTDPFPGHYIRENKVYSKNAYLALESELDDFDLIYAQGFSAWRFIKEKNRGSFKLPILLNFHGLEMYQTPPSLRVKAEYTLLRNSVKWNLKNADYVYSFGGQIDRILLGLGIKQDRILQQFNGIETTWLAEQPTQNNAVRKFIFIGRAERRKGIEELNEALTLLMAENVPFQFSFIGPVPDNKKLKDDRITYYGELRDGERIKELLSEHDCLVCPSHSEGMPTVILEAMAKGLAIIGTNVGAVERQIQGNGILLAEPNINQLKDALQKMINLPNEALSAYKTKSLWLIRESFLWDKIAQQKMKDFEACLALEVE